MSITLPDATSVKTRFPEFASVDDTTITFAIEEAARNVDESWPEADQILAVSYLTAHLLALAGASAGVDGREVVSESIGPIHVTYAQVASASTSGAGSQLGSSAYGKTYQMLLRRHFGGPMSIGGVHGSHRCGEWMPWWPTPRYR